MGGDTTPDLLRRLRAGDRAALDQWFRAHLGGLTRWVDYKVGVPPGHNGRASDVMQNVAIEMLRGIPDHVATEDQLLAWVKTALRHRAIDLARTRVLHTVAPGPAESSAVGPGPLDRGADGATSPSLAAARHERERVIRAGVPAGTPAAAPPAGPGEPPDPAAIVLLRQVDDVSLKEIARGLGRTPEDIARAYYAAVGPVRADLDRLAVGNWPPEQDTDQERLLRAISALPERQRQVVELGHLERDKYSLKEIAAVLGCTPEAAGQLAFRGMKRLREVLDASREPPGRP
jgi:DNA-directed RNA polymerase specialized sigma24 family protein